MSLLITIDTDPDFTPKEALPMPERLISGTPSFKTWAQDASQGEKVLTGVWEATPGETHSIKGTTYEFCHIISGLIEIEEKGGETKTYRAGDSFVMKPGFVGVWRTVETVRKIYVCALRLTLLKVRRAWRAAIPEESAFPASLTQFNAVGRFILKEKCGVRSTIVSHKR